MVQEIRRGDIVLVDWSPGRGSEQQGIRPAVVVQNDLGNQYSSTTIVAAVSTKQTRAYPFHVELTAAESGLNHDSVVKLEQIMTVDRGRLVRSVGRVPPGRLADVDTALKRSLGLN